jgi:DNA topoisomerase VI subunit B
MKMACTDAARKIFSYKDEHGTVYKDINANGFLEEYVPAVKRKSYSIISNKEGEEIVDLTECVTSIKPSIITNKLASKLTSKPISE